MAPDFIYFIKINTALIVFYAFYRLFFYKDTFFNLRRFILLVFFALGFLYPFMNLQDWISRHEPMVEVIQIYSALMTEPAMETVAADSFSWKEVVWASIQGIYLLGVLFFIVRFIIQFASIVWLKFHANQMEINGVQVNVLSKPSGPFSFFRWVFLHPESHTQEEIDEIMTHELTHVRQWHSIDVIISEIICIICWINPFVWLLKREVRHNLEYLADNTVLQCGYDCKSYQYHLLGLVHHQSISNIYNSFNVLHLKNRISMMNKQRSRGIGRTKYLLFIPLVGALMLISNVESVARITINLADNVIPESSIRSSESGTAYDLVAPFQNLSSSFQTLFHPEKKSEDVENKELQPGALILLPADQMPAEKVFTVVEEMPSFPGGDSEMLKFISRSIRYPFDALEGGVQGRVVTTFTVNKNGTISDTQVVRGIHPSLDDEAMRVVNLMPKWKPGKNKGKNVSVRYTLPVVFRLQ